MYLFIIIKNNNQLNKINYKTNLSKCPFFFQINSNSINLCNLRHKSDWIKVVHIDRHKWKNGKFIDQVLKSN